ncbi:WD-40 repeat protein [Anabaenopsis circularis NIES-21]|uniref:WD-40 repeat protein n=1 Tax=Anabaenopsis circularis NIES-21 TaxID=1085406 RepID=A0A1Z4GJ55_9CYAN|nr:WD-40 repeat protein [Anabaenopsis circularis NIES-21]
MTNYYDSKGRLINLTKTIGTGGEGVVWGTNRSGYLAKIYTHLPDTEKVEKLKVMLANPPLDPTLSQNHVSIAWVNDLLYDNRGQCVGFLMPSINQAKAIFEVYNSQLRQKISPEFNWRYLHATALNVAAIVQAIHQKGYVIGDMSQKNFLVNERGMVSVIDTDSFQVTDQNTGKIFRCRVVTPEFTPPELLDKDVSQLTQYRYHDRFRLAVMIYLLLFSGNHAFSGRWNRSENQPAQIELIKQGFWLYGQNSPLQPNQNTIPLDVVHPEIKKLFLKCFNDGHKTPTMRPSPKDWCNALQVAISQLKKCSSVSNHIYSDTYGKCYWCERRKSLGVDIFDPNFKPAVSQFKASSVTNINTYPTINIPVNTNLQSSKTTNNNNSIQSSYTIQSTINSSYSSQIKSQHSTSNFMVKLFNGVFATVVVGGFVALPIWGIVSLVKLGQQQKQKWETEEQQKVQQVKKRQANLKTLLSTKHCLYCDLQGVNLQGADLKQANLTGANLFGANLSNGSFFGAILTDANLKNAELKNTNLNSAALNRANLKNAKLNGARAENTNFRQADLTEAVLESVKANGANFIDAQLVSTSLRMVQMQKVDMRGANLKKADMFWGDFTKANFERANLEAANQWLTNFKGATMPNGEIHGAIKTEPTFQTNKMFYENKPRAIVTSASKPQNCIQKLCIPLYAKTLSQEINSKINVREYPIKSSKIQYVSSSDNRVSIHKQVVGNDGYC